MTGNEFKSSGADPTDSENAESLTGGSMETALRGEYAFSPIAMVGASWRLVKGNKGVLWLAVIVNVLLTMVAEGLLELLLPDTQAMMAEGQLFEAVGLSMWVTVLLAPLTAPLTTGICMLNVKRAAGVPAGLAELFAYFGQVVNLVVLYLLIWAMWLVGIALLILPGIYLFVAYQFAVPLMIDKGLSPWQAMEMSRQAVTKKWFSVFAFNLLLLLILFVSMFTVIGLIWTVPMGALGFGLLYRTIFGFSNRDAVA